MNVFQVSCRWVRAAFIATVVWWMSGSTFVIASEPLVVKDLVVTLVDAVDVPAAETGRMALLLVREGAQVKRGERIASLDDRQSLLQLKLAESQWMAAKKRVDEDVSVELAQKRLEEQQQLASQQEVSIEIANRKAANGIRVEASSKAEAVARNELDRALAAKQEYVESVSGSEIDGLRLAYEKTRLETEQAAFERTLESLQAKKESELAAGLKLGADRASLELTQSKVNREIAGLQIAVAQAELDLARLDTSKHQLHSPLDGTVVKLFRKPGDWVTAGDPVVRVIRLNRLRAEGFAPVAWHTTLRSRERVTLKIQTGDGTTMQRLGEIVFVSPEVDPVNREIAFWVEFDNDDFAVLPGMRLDVNLDTENLDTEAPTP